MFKAMDFYIQAFQTLQRSPSSVWPESVLGKAPYKPILLLAVMDLIEEGTITTNCIRLTPTLTETFERYWQCVVPDRSYNIGMPFYHMHNEGFWHLIPKEGKSKVGIQNPSAAQIRKKTDGARLDQELYELLQENQLRNRLRTALVRSHFTSSVQAEIHGVSNTNLRIYEYSRWLIEQSQEGKSGKKMATRQVQIREAGFRRAIVDLYNHQCAFCNLRIQTPDEHTAVQAAHIIPWSKRQDDDPRNGLALCGVCHWTFDEGLLTLSDDYRILFSDYLHDPAHTIGALKDAEGKIINTPNPSELKPRPDTIRWHRQHVFWNV